MKFLLSLAIATTLMTTSAFAAGACKEYVTVTPDNAPVNRTGFAPGGATGSSKQGNMASLLKVCTDPDSTHPFREAMVRNGACTPNGNEWRSLAEPVGGAVVVKYVTLDGAVPDITEHRNGFNSPIAIPRLGIEQGFNPWPGNAGALQPGGC